MVENVNFVTRTLILLLIRSRSSEGQGQIENV